MASAKAVYDRNQGTMTGGWSALQKNWTPQQIADAQRRAAAMANSRTQFSTSSSTKKKTGLGAIPIVGTTAATRSTITPRPDAPRTGPAPRGTPQPTTTVRDRTYSAPAGAPAPGGGPGPLKPGEGPGSFGTGGGQPGFGNAGNTGAVGGSLTTPLHGFAANFRDVSLPQLYANPDPILAQLMTQMGSNPTGAGAGMFALGQPYMDALNAIKSLAWGGALPPDTSSPINWMAKMMGQGMTPGGAGIDFRDVIGAINGASPDSAVGQMLFGTGMAPQDQVNAVKQMVYGAAQAGLPPEFQRAVQNMMNAQAINYLTGQYGSATPAPFSLPNFYGR